MQNVESNAPDDRWPEIALFSHVYMSDCACHTAAIEGEQGIRTEWKMERRKERRRYLVLLPSFSAKPPAVPSLCCQLCRRDFFVLTSIND